MAIDPSILYCGFSMFEGEKLIDYRLIKPLKPKGSKNMSSWEKGLSVYKQIKRLRKEYGFTSKRVTDQGKVYRTVLEVPSHWSTDGFIARESGAIGKLMMVCGMIYTLGNVEVVIPSGWKCQLPKLVVRRRLAKMKRYKHLKLLETRTSKFGKQVFVIRDDVMDAIGIGTWAIFGKV